MRLLLAVKAQKLLNQGCEGFLCNMLETEAPEPFLKYIPVVQDFPDVFSKEIGSMPPPIEIEFCMDLALRTTPISKALCRIVLLELKELNTQLDKLLDKGYIRQITSPWSLYSL